MGVIPGQLMPGQTSDVCWLFQHKVAGHLTSLLFWMEQTNWCERATCRLPAA